MGIADCGRAAAGGSEGTPEPSGEIWQGVEPQGHGFSFLFIATQFLRDKSFSGMIFNSSSCSALDPHSDPQQKIY